MLLLQTITVLSFRQLLFCLIYWILLYMKLLYSSLSRSENVHAAESHASYGRENTREDMEGLCLASKIKLQC